MYRALSIAALFLLLLTGCAGVTGNLNTSSTGQPQIKSIGTHYKKSLMDIGEVQDRKRQQSSDLGLIYNKEFETYANEILSKLKRVSGMADIPGRVYLKAVRAWHANVTVSGNIYIPIYMLEQIESEDVFAALLAHELSHVIYNHADSELFMEVCKKGASVAAIAYQYSKGSDTAKDYYLNSLRVYTAAELFLNPAWTRSQEREADLLALDLLVRAGYSLGAMEEFLTEVVPKWENYNKSEKHKQQEELMAQQAKIELASTSVSLDITGFTDKSISFVESLTRDHHTAEDRANELFEYVDTHYSTWPRTNYSSKEWLELKGSEGLIKVREGLDDIYNARDYLGKREYRKAERATLGGYNPYTKDQSFLRIVFAQIRGAQGNSFKSIKNHELALNGMYPSFASEMTVFRSKLDREQDQDVRVNLLDNILTIFADYGTPSEYYSPLIDIADKLMQTGSATALRAKCAAKHAGEGVNCGASQQQASESKVNLRTLLGI